MGTGIAGRQLPEERESRVDIPALAVSGDEEAAAQRRLARIVHGQNGGVVGFVPLAGEIRTAFLNPILEIGRGDLVRDVQDRMFRREKGHRRGLVGNAQFRRPTLNGEGVGTKLAGVQFAVRTIVLGDDRAAGLHPGEQPGQGGGEVGPVIEGANPQHDGVQAGQFFGSEVGAGQRDDLVAELRNALGGAVTRAGQVADTMAAGLDFKDHSLGPGRRLQQQDGQMAVVDDKALGAVG